MLRFLIGFCFIALAIWVGLKGPDFFYPKSKPMSHSRTKSSASKSQEEVEAIVNKHLKNTSLAIQMQKDVTEVQLRSQSIKLGQNIFNASPSSDVNSAPAPLDGRDRAHKRVEEPFKRRLNSPLGTPSEKIIDALGEIQGEAVEAEQEKVRFILEFRRNAWYGGYDVRVDESGQVTSVRPLRDHEKGRPFPEAQE